MTGLKEKLRNVSKGWMILGGCILLIILILLGYSAVFRPVIDIAPGRPGIYVKNNGRMDALIYRVDGFWFWAGEVALLDNLPAIHQSVEPGTAPVRLQVPDIPSPVEKLGQEGPWYMKLAVRYGIPGIPVFRYATLLYFRYDRDRQTWTATKTIPPRYRALGNLGIGNVGMIELDFD